MKKRILLIVCVMLTISLLAACAANTPAEAPSPSRPAGDPMSPPPAEADFSPAEVADAAPAFESPALREAGLGTARTADAGRAPMGAGSGAEAPAETDYFMFPTLIPSEDDDRRLVYTVDMVLQTIDFLPGLQLINRAVGGAGGYPVNVNYTGSDLRYAPTEQYAVFYFRLPTEQLPEFIVLIENNFNILSLQQSLQEVTEQYRGVVWSLDDLREERYRLRERLDELEADDAERITINVRLGELNRIIRELEAAQSQIMRGVIYSTLHIQLFEVFLPCEYTLIPSGDIPWPVFLLAGALVLVIIAFAIVFITLRKKQRNLEAVNRQQKIDADRNSVDCV